MNTELKRGYFYALGAYFMWGFFPLYWHLMREVPAAEILCHRIAWSWVFYVLLLYFGRSVSFFSEIRKIPTTTMLKLFVAAVFVSTNWLIYIYAVTSGHVMESSLGYFINPLVNVFLGFLVLRERLNLPQWLAVTLAFAGVTYATSHSEGYVWISLSLAFSFGIYGLIRKTVKVNPLVASCFETMLLVPLAVGYLVFFHDSSGGRSPFSLDLTTLYLIMGGVVTGLPLWWFTEAAVRIPYSTLGFFQYIAPSLQFMTAVLFFQESFGPVQLATFGFIWAGISVYLLDLLMRETFTRRKRAHL